MTVDLVREGYSKYVRCRRTGLQFAMAEEGAFEGRKEEDRFCSFLSFFS